MVSRDVIGSPPNHIMKMQLEKLWASILGAVDVKDFDTWIKEAADLTYQEAKERLIKEYGSPDLESRYKELEERAERAAESGKEEFIEDELKNMGETGEMVTDHIRDLKAQLEETKRKLAEKERRKPKTKTIKAQPLPQEKPEPKSQHTPVPLQQKTVAEYITKLCKQSPLSREEKTKLINTVEIHDIEQAIKIIKDCATLDEFDKFELEERLREKVEGITRQQKESVPKPPTKPKITTMADVTSRREKEEPEVPHRRKKQEEEYTREEARITEMAGTARADTAQNIAEKLKSHLSEIIQYGLREYIRKNNIDIPVNNILLAMLAEELISIWFTKVREPANIREAIGQAIVNREGVMLLASGIEYIKDSNTMRQMYELAKAGNRDIPDFDVVVKDVTKTILQVK